MSKIAFGGAVLSISNFITRLKKKYNQRPISGQYWCSKQ
jgi:hypothetical protein